MPILIGLGGYAKAGKDSVALTLEELPHWRREYMSRPLEEALITMDPWCYVGYDNWVGDTYDVDAFRYHQWLRYGELHKMVGYDPSKNCHDVRYYLQVLGTEIGRKMFGDNVWVDFAYRSIDQMVEEGFNVALTGIRFPNELAALHDHGGTAVWVERPGFGPVNGHASDNVLCKDDFDLVIDNASTLEDLEYFVVNVFVPQMESRFETAEAA